MRVEPGNLESAMYVGDSGARQTTHIYLNEEELFSLLARNEHYVRIAVGKNIWVDVHLHREKLEEK